QVADLGLDVVRADRAVGGGENVVTCLGDHRLPAVGEQRRVRNRRGVKLAYVRQARTDRVDVHAGAQPLPPDQRFGRVRRGDAAAGTSLVPPPVEPASSAANLAALSWADPATLTSASGLVAPIACRCALA